VQNHSPAATDNLLNLMLGGCFASSGRIWTSHSGRCFYDPAKRRAGVPEDVAALVEEPAADSATLVLVDVNPVEPHTVIVQPGGYGEHQFEAVTVGAETKPLGGPLLTVRLEPGGRRCALPRSRIPALWRVLPETTGTRKAELLALSQTRDLRGPALQ